MLSTYIPICVAYNIPYTLITSTDSELNEVVTCAACAQGYYPNTAGSVCLPCSSITASCGNITMNPGSYLNYQTQHLLTCPGSA